MTEDSFSKLMMLLVTKYSRVLKKKNLTGENIPYHFTLYFTYHNAHLELISDYT